MITYLLYFCMENFSPTLGGPWTLHFLVPNDNFEMKGLYIITLTLVLKAYLGPKDVKSPFFPFFLGYAKKIL